MSTSTQTKRGIGQRGPTRRRFIPTYDWLRQKYVEEDLSTQQLCELTGYSKGGMQKLLLKHGFPVKGWSKPKLSISRDTLYQLHVVEGLTAVKIAARFGCHNSAISRLIKAYELDPGRPLINIPSQPPLSHDELWKLYWVDQMSGGQIAERYRVSRSTALRWFKQLDVPTRPWNGGDFTRTYTRSDGPDKRFGREFNAQERERILARDGYHCRVPGCGQRDAWRLEIHHIIPVKQGGTNALENGITLCDACHDHLLGRELTFALLFQELVANPDH